MSAPKVSPTRAGAMGNIVRGAKADAFAASLLPIINSIRASGVTSCTGIAKALNENQVFTARGGHWQAVQVQRMLRRID
ncbi:hypothetical protein [Methylobacterium sp. CM6246]